MMATVFEWKPEPTLLEQLTALAQQQGRSPEAIVTQSVISYLQTQMRSGNLPQTQPLVSLDQRRAFLKLPLGERHRILQAQAETLITHYQTDTEWQELQAGDLIEY
jgi:hypothetical protein